METGDAIRSVIDFKVARKLNPKRQAVFEFVSRTSPTKLGWLIAISFIFMLPFGCYQYHNATIVRESYLVATRESGNSQVELLLHLDEEYGLHWVRYALVPAGQPQWDGNKSPASHIDDIRAYVCSCRRPTVGNFRERSYNIYDGVSVEFELDDRDQVRLPATIHLRGYLDRHSIWLSDLTLHNVKMSLH